MADNWTSEMQAQFNQMQQALTEVIKAELRGTESRLSQHFTEQLSQQLQATEARLSRQYTVAVEDVRGEVRLLGEAFGGTLEAIQRDIQALDEKFSHQIELHAKVLTEHSRDIADLKAKR